MHYFSHLFDKELYMFRKDLLSIIRSINTICTAKGICHANLTNTVVTLLMMKSRSVRNMQSFLLNKFEKL
jgi:hypothetical protein